MCSRIRLLLLYDSYHDIHNHYRRRHHNYCNQHFARSTKAQEVSAIPTPRTLENCHLENAARPSITVIILPLACAEVGFWRIRLHPYEGHRLRSTVDVLFVLEPIFEANRGHEELVCDWPSRIWCHY